MSEYLSISLISTDILLIKLYCVQVRDASQRTQYERETK